MWFSFITVQQFYICIAEIWLQFFPFLLPTCFIGIALLLSDKRKINFCNGIRQWWWGECLLLSSFDIDVVIMYHNIDLFVYELSFLFHFISCFFTCPKSVCSLKSDPGFMLLRLCWLSSIFMRRKWFTEISRWRFVIVAIDTTLETGGGVVFWAFFNHQNSCSIKFTIIIIILMVSKCPVLFWDWTGKFFTGLPIAIQTKSN